MSVKAKFVCNTITESVYNKQAQLTAVYGKEGENADFAKATPSGTFQICIDKDVPASDFFTPGKSYYLTFDEA